MTAETSHSFQTHLIQECIDLGMIANSTFQISGLQSVNGYLKLNKPQQKVMYCFTNPTAFKELHFLLLMPLNIGCISKSPKPIGELTCLECRNRLTL